MMYREFENMPLQASLLGFGAMRLPTDKTGAIDEAKATAMVDAAMAAGINYYDTAYLYHDGASEPFMGKALKKYPRNSFSLATKMPVWLVKEPKDIDFYFNQQLERLQTDYFDFYLLHSLGADSWENVKKLGIAERCRELQKQGKIKRLGFSFHDKYEVFEEIINACPWDFCQLQLNYIDTDTQSGIKGYDLATKLGVPVVIMEPVKGGSLAVLPDDIAAILKPLDENATPAGWALRWAANLPNAKVILSGMSSMAQLEENIATLSDAKPMSAGELAALDKVSTAFAARINNSCTNCQYCMPCPAGVDIPGCFGTWNDFAKYRNVSGTAVAYYTFTPENTRAHNCVGCGQCEAACPQQLHIIDDLKRVAEDMAALQPGK